jgi:thymidine kinase
MIILVIGPMFASKSTSLLAWERRSKYAKRSVLSFNHEIDKRYTSSNEIVTHDGASIKNVISCSKLLNFVEEAKKYDVILIDEGQFFQDIKDFCLSLSEKTIVISALSGDYKKEMFQPVIDLLPMADQIEHLKATCVKCGEDAAFTARTTQDKEQTLVGATDKYEPRCGKCFHL